VYVDPYEPAATDVTSESASPMASYLIARNFSISESAIAAAVVIVLARRICTIPAWKRPKTAKMPISITVIAARSSIMPKPPSSRARSRSCEHVQSTAAFIGNAAMPLKP